MGEEEVGGAGVVLAVLGDEAVEEPFEEVAVGGEVYALVNEVVLLFVLAGLFYEGDLCVLVLGRGGDGVVVAEDVVEEEVLFLFREGDGRGDCFLGFHGSMVLILLIQHVDADVDAGPGGVPAVY